MHETELKSFPPDSMATGLVHVDPLNVRALPLPSTATQKVADTQETELIRV